jgi:2-methylisocitrate lyase-like PEP mutase family enzyme
VDCGVDVLFVEAVRTVEHMDVVCSRFGHQIPLFANMVEGGKTPVLSVDELSARGYSIVIFPGGTVRFLAKQMQHYFSSLKQNGSTRALSADMLDFDGLNELIGTPELLALGKRYDG